LIELARYINVHGGMNIQKVYVGENMQSLFACLFLCVY